MRVEHSTQNSRNLLCSNSLLLLRSNWELLGTTPSSRRLRERGTGLPVAGGGTLGYPERAHDAVQVHQPVARIGAQAQPRRSTSSDLCRLLGEPTPAEADPTGEAYCFERAARKDTGGDGWADAGSTRPNGSSWWTSRCRAIRSSWSPATRPQRRRSAARADEPLQRQATVAGRGARGS